jgi:hypothetical protein
MPSDESASMLLALPDPCLLAVLQCCASDSQRSLLSAARAHCRLHKAAVLVLRNITTVVEQQQQADSVLLYLGRHGQHVDNVDLRGVTPRSDLSVHERVTVSLRQLHPNLQLNSLHLAHMHLQLQPGDGFQGVLGAAAPLAALKQLSISYCELLDAEEGRAFAAALSLLPTGLEHISLKSVYPKYWELPSRMVQSLQQLTYLELAHIHPKASARNTPALEPLEGLTRLQNLRLADVEDAPCDGYNIFDDNEDFATLTTDMLSASQHLTRLQLENNVSWEVGVLEGKTLLQHLDVTNCPDARGVAPSDAELLSHLQQLQQLTHLALPSSMVDEDGEDTPPAAAYSALTASSKLQHLDIEWCTMPPGVWQHVFPAGRQLPHLQSLNISRVGPHRQSIGTEFENISAPEGSRLVSCCPGLQWLNMQDLHYSAGLLASLQGLTGLHTLIVRPARALPGPGPNLEEDSLESVLQLTRLRELSVSCPRTAKEGLLLQLTQLTDLAALTFVGNLDGHFETVKLTRSVSDGRRLVSESIAVPVPGCPGKVCKPPARVLQPWSSPGSFVYEV